MDDKPSDETPKKEFNKLDLTQLEDFSFGTEWTKDKTQPDSGRARRDDRPRRDSPRTDRRGFKRSSGPVPGGGGGPGGQDRRGGGNRPPRGDGKNRGPGGQDRRGGGNRPPRGDGKNRGHGGQDRRGGGGGDRRGRGGRPMFEGPYVSPHFEATFYPEDVSFAALAKTIRSSARTFELFDIAKTVIGKNDRFVVVLEHKNAKPKEDGTKPHFYVCLLDGMPFESEEAAMNHVVQNHLSRFFSITEEEGEPPKGSFQVINKCGVTGELLGPPNYHLYTQIVQQHHASRLPRMSFDNFSYRIESVRDPEVVEQWLQSMKTITRYTWLGDANVPLKPETAATEEPKKTEESASAAEPAAAPAEDSAAAPVESDNAANESAETVSTEAPEASATNEVASDEPSTEASVEVESVGEAGDSSSEVVEEAPPVAAPAEPIFGSVTAAKVHLITHAREKSVRTYEHGRFHGRILDEMPDGEIKRAVAGALDRQKRFPLDTANALRGRLRRAGFTIFKKGSKGISYVSAVKRKFRVAGQTFADSINDLITFVEKNPMVKVSELTEKFLQITPPEDPKLAESTPTATTPGTVSPFGEADQPRIKRMQLDLRWLVTEGYVTEFIDGTLFAAAPMPPPKPKEPAKIADAPKAEAKVEEPVAGTPPAESAATADATAEPEPSPVEPPPAAPEESPSAEPATEPQAEPKAVTEPAPAEESPAEAVAQEEPETAPEVEPVPAVIESAPANETEEAASPVAPEEPPADPVIEPADSDDDNKSKA